MNFYTIENTTLLNLPFQAINHSYFYQEDRLKTLTMDQCFEKW